MIPVLIAPTYNRHDLLDRMLHSIDVPVGRGLIIDNGMTGYQKPDDVGPEWHLMSPPWTSLGYPGSINFGIMQTPDAPWWMWVSNDVVFGDGDLARFVELMDTDEPRIVSWHFAMGALNRAVVERVGLFDEWAFWPLYFDDNDYAYRCQMSGIPVTWYDGNMTEGADGHETSMTIFSDPAIRSRNAETWALNKAEYVAKWGGPPGHERLRTPYGRRGPLWSVQPSVNARRDRLW